MREQLHRYDPQQLSDAEILRALALEQRGAMLEGELPLEDAQRRQRALESPSYLATDIVDPWYARHFEPIHYRLLDEVLAPYILGESFKIEGVTYDAKDWRGLLILWSRSTLKSTIAKLIVLWDALYRKLALPEKERHDARTAFIHQILEKAQIQGESLKDLARQNPKFRGAFPEFCPGAKAGKDWDTKTQWRWPCFTTYQAGEYSFTAYGERSAKTGGHYRLRVADDWVNEESVNTAPARDESERHFKQIDNLRDRAVRWNPWITIGTYYHFDDTYRRLEKTGGWLVWKVPGHRGSSKKIFDLLAINDRSAAGRREIETGLLELEQTRAADLNFPGLLDWRELYGSCRAQTLSSSSGISSTMDYSCQILLNPVPEGEWRFPHDRVDEAWTDSIPGPEDGVLIHVRIDPAIGIKKAACETALNLALVDWRGWRWYVDSWVGRERRPSETLRRAFRMLRKWIELGYEAHNLGVESVQLQEGMAQQAREGVPVRDAEYEGESIPIMTCPCPVVSIERSPDIRKEERIIATEFAWVRREVRIWRQNPFGERIAQDHKDFPGGRMDILDTCADMYVKARKGTPPLDGAGWPVKMHRIFEELLRSAMIPGGKKRPSPMQNRVQLQRWGRS